MKTKHLLLTLLMAFIVPLAANAQTVYSENFDSYSIGSSAVTPTGWTVTTSGSGVYATVINANAYSTPNSFLMGNPAALTANRSVVAVLPTFDLLNLNCTKLTFRVKSSSASMGDNTLSVGYTYSDLSGDHTQILYTCDASTSYSVVTLSYNLSAVPSGARIIFRYNGKKDAPAQTYWYIDNVLVESDLLAPSNLTVSDVTASTANLTWTMNGNGSAQAMYSTQSDFSDPQYSTTGSLTDLEGFTTYYVKVRARARKNASSMWFYSSWSDPVEFTTLCATPTNLSVYSEPGQGVTVTWDGNASSCEIRYENMENIFNYYNGSVYATGNSYTFTGAETVPLMEGMKYRFRIKAQCDFEDETDWSDWVTFVDCPNYMALPMHANFDYMPVSTTNAVNNLPGCWSYFNNSTDSTYSNYPLVENNQSLCHSNYYPQGQYNYIRFNIPVNGKDQYLVFPPVDPVSSNGVTISFWVRSVSTETATNFIVGLMDNTLNTNSFYYKTGNYFNSHSTSYVQKTFTFTYDELVEHGNYIVIKAPASSNYQVSFCLDDIDIYPADYHCDEPVNVHAENLSLTSAEIVWENPVTGGGEWGFKYKKDSDDEWNVVYDNGLVSNHYPMYDLEQGTTYNVGVINNCNSVDHSEWVEYSFTTLDVIPVPTNLAIDEDNTGSSWVTLTWECTPVTGQNEVSKYELEVSEDGETWHGPDGTAYSMWWTANQNIMINCLDRGQHYFHVRVVDPEENEGAWSEAVAVTLESCDSPVVIDSEHSASYNFNATHLPDCWTVTGNYDKIVLGSSLAFWVNGNYETYVELPRFNISDSDYDGIKLSFDWEQMPLAWDNGTQAGVQVQCSANGTQWSNVGDFISMYGDVESIQTVRCVRNIPASNSTLYVRLKMMVEDYHSFSYIPPQCSIDNLNVIGQSICGDTPTDLHIVDGYPENKRMFVSWTAGNNEQEQWQLAISKDSNSSWQVTQPFTSTDCTMGFNVDHSSTYYVKVRACCDNSHYSGWSNVIMFTTPYFGKIFTGAEDNLWSNANNWTGGIPNEDYDVLLQADVTVTGEAEACDIDLGEYTITVEAGGVLNANAFIGENADNPFKTVIKDGGQVKSNTPFLATIEKNIIGYGAENVNDRARWYLVATPTSVMVNDVYVPKNGSEYLFDQMDFYWFNGGQELEWVNPKCSSAEGCETPSGIIPQGSIYGATMAQPKHGYLYARQEDATLQITAGLVGNMHFPATNVDTDVDLNFYSNVTNAPLNGWNLIGNPFTCDAYLLDNEGNPIAFYRMNDTGDRIVLAEAGTAIKPCEGVFVQVTDNGSGNVTIVTFTSTEPSRNHKF